MNLHVPQKAQNFLNSRGTIVLRSLRSSDKASGYIIRLSGTGKGKDLTSLKNFRRSRRSSGDIANSCGLDGPGIEILIGPSDFLFSNTPRTALGPWFLGLKRPKCQGDHSSPSSAEVNEKNCTSPPPIRPSSLWRRQGLLLSIYVCTFICRL